MGRKGLVKDPEVHREVLITVLAEAARHGLVLRDVAPSPLKGADGNIEFFAWWDRSRHEKEVDAALQVERAVEEAWEKQ